MYILGLGIRPSDGRCQLCWTTGLLQQSEIIMCYVYIWNTKLLTILHLCTVYHLVELLLVIESGRFRLDEYLIKIE